MYCRKCGQELKETSRFCKMCGTPVMMESTIEDEVSRRNSRQYQSEYRSGQRVRQKLKLLFSVPCGNPPLDFACRYIVSDKGGIVAVNGIRRIEQHRFKVLFDIADFGGILFHAVKDKFNVTAVQLHKLCLDKLCRVIVPGDTDCLSLAAYRFKDNRNNFV